MNFDFYKNPKSKGVPCSVELFLNTLRSTALKEQIIKIRKAVQDKKPIGEIQNLKANLPCVTWQAHCSTLNHTAKNCSPSGLYMIDIDHVDLRALREHLDNFPRYREMFGVMAEHYTPSGEGYRIVCKFLEGEMYDSFTSISDWQNMLSNSLKLNDKFPIDKACKDLSRLSFLVPYEDFVYLDMAMFTLPCPRQGSQLDLFNQKKSNNNETQIEQRPVEETAGVNDIYFSDEQKNFSFKGRKISEIAELYVQKHGAPEIGTRHVYYLQMARDFRYICDNNSSVLLYHLPSFDKPFNERKDICKYVVKEEFNRTIPKRIYDVIKNLQQSETATTEVSEDYEDYFQEEQEQNSDVPKFPRIFDIFARITPPKFLWAQINAVGCCLGANMNIQATYLDNTIHTPTFHSVIIADPGSGKSFAKRTVDKLTSNMRLHDEISEAKEKQFFLEYRKTKNSKNPTQRPRLPRRRPHAIISQVELLQRLDDNGGSHMLFFMPELDTFAKSNKRFDKGDMFRQGFDNDEYGQDFKSENSFNGTVKLFMNVLATGTDGALYRMYGSPENGMVSRLTISSLGDQHFTKMPNFKQFTKKEDEVINDLVKWCEDTTYLNSKEVQIELIKPRLDFSDKCDFLDKAIAEWLEKKRIEAMEQMDYAIDDFRRRCGVMGWRFGLVAIGCYKGQLNDQRKKKIANFACWCADKSLESLLVYYGEEERTLASKGRRQETANTGTLNAFRQLPDKFGKDEVDFVLKKCGVLSPIKQVIYRWKKEGLIKRISINGYEKNKK